MIAREAYLIAIETALRRYPIAMLLGPRQSGKSTLARMAVAGAESHFFGLEIPAVAAALREPYTVLAGLKGVVVLDEAQRLPELFPVLRVLADRHNTPARFLLLGSASPELARQANESLAGRVEMIDVRGFDLSEVGADEIDPLWLRGGFPRSFLAAKDEDSLSWRDNFIRSFVERDLGVLGFNVDRDLMTRFWTMLTHYHGQVLNASQMAVALKVSAHTVNNYLAALEQTYMVRRLLPWFENVKKRVVKSPKIYIRDTGILHALQNIGTQRDLTLHPQVGSSWEGFAMEEVIHALQLRSVFYYGVHSGAELDLFFLHKGKRIGVEFKRMDAPRLTKSMRVVMDDLRLDRLWVIYPGSLRYPLGKNMECLPLVMIDEMR